MKKASSFITGLIAGVAIGGIVALLYAPESGKETRDRLKTKLEGLEKEFEILKGKAAQKTGNIKKDLAERLAALQKEIETLIKSV